jgi:hypothetical protein
MTNDQIVAFVYSHIGGEKESGILKPQVLMLATLALADMSHHFVANEPEKARLLEAEATNQTWASSSFSMPSDFLYTDTGETLLRVDIGGTLAHRVNSRSKIDLTSGATLTNHYYALEGKKLYIRHASGTTGASDLNIRYYKMATFALVDENFRQEFIDFVLRRVALLKQAKAIPSEPQ